MSSPAGSRILVALRGALYAAVFVLLWGWLGVSLMPLDERIPIRIPAWLRPVGSVVVVFGGALLVACVATFIVSGRGTPAPFDPPRRVVAHGPYGYARNPMYVGALTTIAGAGLILRSPSLLGLAILFALLAHLFVILYEEPTLERRFGEEYRRYKATVPRWIPRPRSE